MKLGSLFDGIGGFPLAASRYGIKPVWASEIEPSPIRVTQHHFPSMEHLGDITKINGAEIEPVDIITFGSPCQDLSVAGKREGLEGARSGLFMDAVRIVREMRTATGGEYPRFAVWENVPGAFSSNRGQDFRAVLEEIAEAEIPMPTSGKWAEAGMVRTERIDIAWRTLDAQYWGVPQRRKRIFLVADFTGQCAGEILFIEQGLRGDFTESGEAREETAGDVGNGFKAAGFKSEQSAAARSIGWQIETAPTLPSEGSTPCICSRINCTPEGITGAVSSKWAKGTGGPAGDESYNLIIEPRSQDGTCRVYKGGIVPTLNTAQGGQRQPCVVAFAANQRDEVRDLGDKLGALQAEPGMKQQSFVIQNATRGKSQNGLGVSQDDVSYTLDSLGNHAVATGYAVRRLTPLETERLQGLPDGWTNIPPQTEVTAQDLAFWRTVWDTWDDINEKKHHSDNQIKSWLHSEAKDTARYKAIGNSVAIPCVEYVMAGIARVIGGG